MPLRDSVQMKCRAGILVHRKSLGVAATPASSYAIQKSGLLPDARRSMHVTITALGPDNRALADPIVHHVTSSGANIAEIQMYDHDVERVFAMMVRLDWPVEQSLSPTCGGR